MSKIKKMKARLSGSEIARYIDQSLLKADASEADIIKLCKAAIKYNFYAVCVNPYYVPLCKAILTGHNVKVAAVVGFPLGMNCTETKVQEAKTAVKYGAHELDIVMNIGAAKSGNWHFIENETSAIMAASRKVVHKMIIETCLLSDKEKVAAAKAALVTGVSFIKTSTGFGTKGAEVRDVKLLKKLVGDRAQIKASGGIKTLAQVLEFLEAGASRIGTSAGVEIMRESMEKIHP